MGMNLTPHTALTVPSDFRSPRWVSASPSDCKYQLTGSLIPVIALSAGTEHTSARCPSGFRAAGLHLCEPSATQMITTPLVVDQCERVLQPWKRCPDC